MSKRNITSVDVAQRAGVSQSAVSRTFTIGASVSAKTRDKVLTAARELGYRPNAIARSLITSRSRMIGVVMAYLENQFYPGVLEALSGQLQERGYQVLLFTGFKDRNSDPFFEQIMQYQVDGLLLASTSLSSALSEECAKAGIPVVMFNRTTRRRNTSSVTTDNRQGGRHVADFLVAGSHKRYGYVAGVTNSSTNRDREAGFFEGLKTHGITNGISVPGENTMSGAAEAARTLLKRRHPPDAIFVNNDNMAIAVMDVAKSEFGLKVPDDVSIVSYDDTGPASWHGYQLTSYAQPLRPMVDAAVALLMAQLEDNRRNPVHTIIEGHLAVRTSARLPRAAVYDSDDQIIWSPSNVA
ncbi:MAG: LacI family DNA-binding transcriptional regulator [Hyphomicrobiaceae bacterium]